MRCAVLDLGSNSYHVLVADLDGRSVAPVLREREMLHLGRTVARHGEVPEDARDQAVATVRHLAELARRTGAQQVLAVATAALREASNGQAVIAALSEAAGAEVEVLPGLEEARLAYLGVRAAVAVRSEPVLVLDLGGGSLELAIGVGDRVVWCASTRLGASSLSARLTDDPPGPAEVAALRALVDAELDPLVDVVRAHAPGTTIAVGGTVRALGRLSAAERGVWLPATLNQLRMDTSELARLEARLLAVDESGRRDLPAMKSRRADHVHVAAVILTRVLQRLGTTTSMLSDWGLREGMLLDRHAVSSPPGAVELRSDEVERIRGAFGIHDPHPDHVATLADRLFVGTRELHGLTDLDRELLCHAARLHALGEAVALRRQQVHGAYLLENAELRGFSPTETAILSTLVRFHRSRGIGDRFPAYASLSAADRQRTERLLALLQVADGLDRAHDQAVTDVAVELDRGRVTLTLTGDGLHVTPDELARKTRWFARAFGVDVEVRDPAAVPA
jgi:exopolyphosphatase / guanosine-5'-triphosphate,3'-diphosphate pyrophosphatase